MQKALAFHVHRAMIQGIQGGLVFSAFVFLTWAEGF